MCMSGRPDRTGDGARQIQHEYIYIYTIYVWVVVVVADLDGSRHIYGSGGEGGAEIQTVRVTKTKKVCGSYSRNQITTKHYKNIHHATTNTINLPNQPTKQASKQTNKHTYIHTYKQTTKRNTKKRDKIEANKQKPKRKLTEDNEQEKKHKIQKINKIACN